VSKAIGHDPNSAAKVDVPIVGFKRPVAVLITLNNQRLPGGNIILAPDTRHVKIFITLDRGENYHGSLREDFFVCRDGDFDYEWTVLWMALNASQAQDDVQRLQPSCLLAAGWQPDDLDEEITSLIDAFDALELEGLILLWAYVHYAAIAWGREFLAGAKIKSGFIKSAVAGMVLQAGTNGEPLDLIQVYDRVGRTKEEGPL
jgi:hypothetical protein